jgi:hypothetical protein
MNTRELKTTEEIIKAIKFLKEAETVRTILVNETCKDEIIERKFVKKYGFDKLGLLASIVQSFYLKGKEDALQEIKQL